MRLFIAIDIPSELQQALCRLRSDIPGARWVPDNQIHLTLAFLGEVEANALEELQRNLAKISVPCFQLHFKGTGCFPDRRRPRVLWVGLDPQPLLDGLAARVRSAVLSSGISQEERPFSPHITLARFKIPAPREVGAFLDKTVKHRYSLFSVKAFVLFESCLSSSGAIHKEVRSFSLG